MEPFSPPAVLLRGLVKRFRDVVAVDGVDLTIRAGECFGLLGPNGAGKTTTIEIVEGLQAPTGGDVEILGLRWDRDARRIRPRIGVQLQETQLPGQLTVRETLSLFASFYDVARPVADVLSDVGLDPKATARVQTLSGGQRQRLAVGCALVSDPEILFLDEPTTGLDPAARRGLWDVIRRFQARGRTVVLTTHYMEEAERLCDRIAIVDRGRIVALGTPAELIARVGGEEVVELRTVPGLAAAVLAAVPGVQSVRTTGDEHRLVVVRLHEALPALLERVAASGARADRLATHQATLEDVFLQVTGRRFEEADVSAAPVGATG
jgi:ABC-2 type transport system ATP-binding protein